MGSPLSKPPPSELRRTLGFAETAAISIAMMAPTAAMAVNPALAAATAGVATPLAFVLAFAVIGCVAYAFVVFARTYATAGSVYAFAERAFGARVGALAAWMLLLTYVCFTAGSLAEAGAFASAAAEYAGRSLGWLPIALVAAGICTLLGLRAAKGATRAMLAFELVSLVAVVLLCAWIVVRGGAHPSAPPLAIANVAPGGLGLAAVFALLSFAGFEGAAVLGAESRDPRRTIPRALIASVAMTGILYVAIASAEAFGFGFDARGISVFAKSQSPLGDLALRYAGKPFATVVSLGAALSGFAAALASATGAARLLYALAQEKRIPKAFGSVDVSSATPLRAYLATMFVATALACIFAVGGFSGVDTFAACGVIGTLALLLVYACVQVAALKLFAHGPQRTIRIVVPSFAFAALFLCFLANIYPIPSGIGAIYPFVTLAWLVLGVVVVARRGNSTPS